MEKHFLEHSKVPERQDGKDRRVQEAFKTSKTHLCTPVDLIYINSTKGEAWYNPESTAQGHTRAPGWCARSPDSTGTAESLETKLALDP